MASAGTRGRMRRRRRSLKDPRRRGGSSRRPTRPSPGRATRPRRRRGDRRPVRSVRRPAGQRTSATASTAASEPGPCGIPAPQAAAGGRPAQRQPSLLRLPAPRSAGAIGGADARVRRVHRSGTGPGVPRATLLAGGRWVHRASTRRRRRRCIRSVRPVAYPPQLSSPESAMSVRPAEPATRPVRGRSDTRPRCNRLPRQAARVPPKGGGGRAGGPGGRDGGGGGGHHEPPAAHSSSAGRRSSRAPSCTSTRSRRATRSPPPTASWCRSTPPTRRTRAPT